MEKTMEIFDKTSITNMIKETREAILKSGFTAKETANEWFMKLVFQSMKAYSKNANHDYFSKKYPGKDNEFIEQKLIKTAVAHATMLGGVAGAFISAEYVPAVTLGPFAIPAVVAGLFAELFVLTKIQLQLIMNIASLNGIKIDPDDPEDILVVFYSTVAGTSADALGKTLVRGSTHISAEMTKRVFTKKATKLLEQIGVKIGVKLLQKTVTRFVVPVVSIVVGAVWNRQSTKLVAKYASSYFKKQKEERSIIIEDMVSYNDVD